MLASSSGLLGDEMGVGKTVQALQFIEVMDKKSTLPALVIVPNSTKYHWERLARRWAPSATTYVVAGTAGQRRKLLDIAAADPTALVIVSLETTRSMSRLAPYGSVKLKRCRECDPKRGDEIKPAQCQVHPKELNAIRFATVVLDEAHRIKDPSSQQTRAVWYLMHSEGVCFRWALTGTMISKSPGDLWPIMHSVAPEEWPVRTKFVDRYCLMDWNPFGGMDIVGLRPDTKEEFFRIFDPRFRRMLKSVVLPQLPEIVREIRTCDLTPAMRRVYDEIYTGLASKLPDGTLMVAWNDMVKQGRLQQLASSAIEIEKPDEDDILTWKITMKDPSTKLDVMEETLKDLGYDGGMGPAVVIAAESKQLIGMAAARLTKRGIPYALITGDVEPYERENALDALRQGDIRILLFTIKAGGVGLDMSAADTLIFLQQPWSMIERLQTEGRVHRIGSEIHDSVKIIDIVTRDTMEEEQIERVHDKLRRLEEITRDGDARERAAIESSNVLDPMWPGDDGDDAPPVVVAGYLEDLKRERHLFDDQHGGVWEHEGHPDACDAPECNTPPIGAVSVIDSAGQDQTVDLPYPISASKMKDFDRCRRKWWLTWYLNLQLDEDQMGVRATGTRVHKALAGWYVPEADGPIDPRDGIETAITEDWKLMLDRLKIDEEHPQFEEIHAKWMSSNVLERAMVEGYMEWLEETGEDAGLTFVASETELHADIETYDHHGRLLIVRAMGKLDARAIRDVDGARLFVDHKTVGDFTRPMKMIQMDPQMLMYHLLEFLNTEEGEARCDGALYNMIRRVKRTAAAKPPFFAREPVRMNPIQIESFKRNMLGAARDMVAVEEALESGADPMDVVRPTRDDDCSWKCDFYPVCPLFNDGSRAEDMISALYHQGDPWGRYDHMKDEKGGQDADGTR
jgi:superfamily II DNA or RNA helicase